jgi:hypothetical protein
MQQLLGDLIIVLLVLFTTDVLTTQLKGQQQDRILLHGSVVFLDKHGLKQPSLTG